MNNPFIVTSDIHLCSKRPLCRLEEDWISTQCNYLKFVASMCSKYDCRLIIAGDITDKPKDFNIELLNRASDIFDTIPEINVISGNHDIVTNNNGTFDRTVFKILCKMTKTMKHLCYESKDNVHYIDFIKDNNAWMQKVSECNSDIAIIHKFVYYRPEDNHVHDETSSADNILKAFPNTKLIIAGDNHRGFIYKKGNQTLLNCGVLFRDTADLIDYKPQIYYIDENANVTPIPVPIDKDAITNTYILKEQERKQKEEVFIKTILSNKNVSIDFKKNLYNIIDKLDCECYIKETCERILL